MKGLGFVEWLVHRMLAPTFAACRSMKGFAWLEEITVFEVGMDGHVEKVLQLRRRGE